MIGVGLQWRMGVQFQTCTCAMRGSGAGRPRLWSRYTMPALPSFALPRCVTAFTRPELLLIQYIVLRPFALGLIRAGTDALLPSCSADPDTGHANEWAAIQVAIAKDSRVLDFFAWLLMQPDEILLDAASTSPAHEKPDFPGTMRATARWALQTGAQASNGPTLQRRYSWQDDQWVCSNPEAASQ